MFITIKYLNILQVQFDNYLYSKSIYQEFNIKNIREFKVSLS